MHEKRREDRSKKVRKKEKRETEGGEKSERIQG